MKQVKCYEIDMVIHKRKQFEPRVVCERFTDHRAAVVRRHEVEDSLEPDERLGWNKVYPVVECCGQELDCYNFTNTCYECGADYNFNGTRLAPRYQWGEETGEHWTEIP